MKGKSKSGKVYRGIRKCHQEFAVLHDLGGFPERFLPLRGVGISKTKVSRLDLGLLNTKSIQGSTTTTKTNPLVGNSRLLDI